MSRFSKFTGLRGVGDVAETPGMPRRAGHGDTAYTSAAGTMKQPQDGALQDAKHTYQRVPTMVSEPEDARLTGLTRSLGRRLMGLNLMNTIRKTPVAAQTAKLAKFDKIKSLPAA